MIKNSTEWGGGPLLNFNKKFIVPVATTATIRLVSDDCADLFINCKRIGQANLNQNGVVGNVLTFAGIALSAGCNIIQLVSRNLAGDVGLTLTMTDDKDGAVITKSDKTWSWTVFPDP